MSPFHPELHLVLVLVLVLVRAGLVW